MPTDQTSPSHVPPYEADAFVKEVYESLSLERKGRFEASGNSSHVATVEGFSKASPQIAALLRDA
jgi:hypothetical protein